VSEWCPVAAPAGYGQAFEEQMQVFLLLAPRRHFLPLHTRTGDQGDQSNALHRLQSSVLRLINDVQVVSHGVQSYNISRRCTMPIGGMGSRAWPGIHVLPGIS
jgi:hypothetical protein